MIAIVNPNGNMIHVLGRDENGRRTVIEDSSFKLYFYVKDKDGEFQTIFGDKVKKVFCDNPKDVSFAKANYEHYEADVKFVDRYLIDKIDDMGNDKLRVWLFDIEVDSSQEFPKPEEGKWPIISLSLYDNLLDKILFFAWKEGEERKKYYKKIMLYEKEVDIVVHIFSSEKQMLYEFFKFIRKADPDILAGWNLVKFDMQYLYNRLRNIGLNFNLFSNYGSAYYNEEYEKVEIKGRTVIDLMKVYERFSHITQKGSKILESLSLNNVANSELELKKVKLEDNVGVVWRTNFDNLIDYAIGDVVLMKKLDEKLKFIEILNEMRRLFRCRFEKIMEMSYVVDIALLRFCKSLDLVLPSKKEHRKEKIVGALVLEPKPGIYKDVAIYDVRSLYPSSIITFNLSPDSIMNGEGEYILVNNVKFSKNKLGVIPSFLRELLKKRLELKDKMRKYSSDSDERFLCNVRQQLVKLVMNSTYGLVGYKYFRLFNNDVANAVTWCGREILKFQMEILNEKYTVCYCDTDAVFVILKNVENIIEDSKELEVEINKNLDVFVSKFGITSHCLSFELEQIYSSLLFFGVKSVVENVGAKKKYIGWLKYYDGKEVDRINYMGIEMRRRDTSKFAKDVLEDFYTKVLLGESKEKIFSYLKEQYKIMKAKHFSEVTFTIRVGKDMSAYKVNAQHYKGMVYSQKYLKKSFSRMDFIKVVFVRAVKAGFPKTDILCLREDDEFPDGFEIDYDRIIKRTIEMKLEQAFKLLNWSLEEFRGQKSLKNWMR